MRWHRPSFFCALPAPENFPCQRQTMPSGFLSHLPVFTQANTSLPRLKPLDVTSKVGAEAQNVYTGGENATHQDDSISGAVPIHAGRCAAERQTGRIIPSRAPQQ